VAGHGRQRRRAADAEGGDRLSRKLWAGAGEREEGLFEHRLLSSMSPTRRGAAAAWLCRSESPAIQAKHAAARARAALQKTTRAMAAEDRERTLSNAGQRTALREFVRQQRKAEREWEKLVGQPYTTAPQDPVGPDGGPHETELARDR
jgi:hypothetical protein